MAYVFRLSLVGNMIKKKGGVFLSTPSIPVMCHICHFSIRCAYHFLESNLRINLLGDTHFLEGSLKLLTYLLCLLRGSPSFYPDIFRYLLYGHGLQELVLGYPSLHVRKQCLVDDLPCLRVDEQADRDSVLDGLPPVPVLFVLLMEILVNVPEP